MKRMKRFAALFLMLLTLLGAQTASAGMYTGTALPDKPKTCKHHWVRKEVIEEPTCIAAGKGRYECSNCGKTKNAKIKKTGHQYGEWVSEDGVDCKHGGKMTSVCLVCGKTRTKKVTRGDHQWGEWEIITEPTATAKGKRTATCTVCGKTTTRDYYPLGTLYPDGEQTSEDVTALQNALKSRGYYKKKITGVYDKNTIAAVKKFQKKMGLKVDGIAWPETMHLLGLDLEPGMPITRTNLSSYKLQLTVTQTSEPQDVYQVGDVITFEWSLTNVSSKYEMKSAKLYLYRGSKPKKKTDTELTTIDDAAQNDTVTGTYEYTVTEKNAEAGSFTIGFVCRGKLNKKVYTSNTVSFVQKAE